jgi:hypothetical protein
LQGVGFQGPQGVSSGGGSSALTISNVTSTVLNPPVYYTYYFVTNSAFSNILNVPNGGVGDIGKYFVVNNQTLSFLSITSITYASGGGSAAIPTTGVIPPGNSVTFVNADATGYILF